MSNLVQVRNKLFAVQTWFYVVENQKTDKQNFNIVRKFVIKRQTKYVEQSIIGDFSNCDFAGKYSPSGRIFGKLSHSNVKDIPEDTSDLGLN